MANYFGHPDGSGGAFYTDASTGDTVDPNTIGAGDEVAFVGQPPGSSGSNTIILRSNFTASAVFIELGASVVLADGSSLNASTVEVEGGTLSIGSSSSGTGTTVNGQLVLNDDADVTVHGSAAI